MEYFKLSADGSGTGDMRAYCTMSTISSVTHNGHKKALVLNC
jgi:hypothetical protein